MLTLPFYDKRKLKGLLVKPLLPSISLVLWQYTDVLKNSIENTASCIDSMVNGDIQMRIDENKHIIRQIVCAILFLGKQRPLFHVYNKDLCSTKNLGNVLTLLKYFSESDSIIFKHLNKPRAKNATYISQTSQNDIINVIGHDIILANIVAEIKLGKFYSVLADEVAVTTSSNYLFAFDLWTVNATFGIHSFLKVKQS